MVIKQVGELDNIEFRLLIYMMPSVTRDYSGAVKLLVREVQRGEDQSVIFEGVEVCDVVLNKIIDCPFRKNAVMMLVEKHQLNSGIRKMNDFVVKHEKIIGKNILSQVNEMSLRLSA